MNVKRGLFRTVVVAACFVFAVGLVHRILTEVLAALLDNPSWLQGLESLLTATAVVLVLAALLPLLFPGSLAGIFRWVGNGFR